MDIHPLTAADLDRLHDFFKRIPAGDRTFFHEDVTDSASVARWPADSRSLRVVAEENALIVGYLALIPDVGWSSHVGELRLVIDPRYRRRGFGRHLALHALTEAIAMGLGKVTVGVVADQVATIELFQGLGFRPEALLVDHVRDGDGNLHDLIVLAHLVDETRGDVESIGLDRVARFG